MGKVRGSIIHLHRRRRLLLADVEFDLVVEMDIKSPGSSSSAGDRGIQGQNDVRGSGREGDFAV